MKPVKSVTFYFANPTQDKDGNPVLNEPPESHTLSWQQVVDNVGFALSSGESIFTELPVKTDTHIIRIVNGFYFGEGKFGSLLGIQYNYEDGSDGWVGKILYRSDQSLNTDAILGNWIKGLTYEQITTHKNWKGKPLIGVANSYLEFQIAPYLPDMVVSLSPLSKTIQKGESITFDYNSTDFCEGEATYKWTYNADAIVELSKTKDKHMLQFNKAGTYPVTVSATNACGQEAHRTAEIVVTESDKQGCDIQLTPDRITIRLGETATFTALHPYKEEGVWTYDLSMQVLIKDIKTLKVKPKALGSYLISFRVKDCQQNAILYVLEAPTDGGENPKEPNPPPLPDTPPDKIEKPNLVIDLIDASRPIPPLYKYPNIMKRNSRYRGHRESEKVLNDHQEQIYDIRQLYTDLSNLEVMKDTTIDAWFNGIANLSISMKLQENKTITEDSSNSSNDIELDSVRAFQSDMVQLSGNSFEERIVGVYGIKRKMQELDERVAEAERRYREYENAYE